MTLPARIRSPREKRTNRTKRWRSHAGLLHYDGETGLLTWLYRPRDLFATERSFKTWNARFAGNQAFTCTSDTGYKIGRIDGRAYYAHRIIWEIVHGSPPSGEIDHINGVRTDNRIANLREVTRNENRRNVKRPSTNKSGFIGVMQKGASWEARIQRGGKQIYLGRFGSAEEAVAARSRAELAFGFHPNHGRPE